MSEDPLAGRPNQFNDGIEKLRAGQQVARRAKQRDRPDDDRVFVGGCGLGFESQVHANTAIAMPGEDAGRNFAQSFRFTLS